MLRHATVVAVSLAACAQGEPSFRETVDASATALIPSVEAIVGVSFRDPPRIEIRTQEQVGDYITRRIAADLPRDRMEGVSAAYRLFGFISDTLDLPTLFEALLREQVAGYFDPDSGALFLIDGTDPTLLSFTLGHELVHALQDQHVDLSGLMDPTGPNDYTTTVQAVMEGQATWAALRLLASEAELERLGNFEDLVRDALELQRAQLPVFTSAPLVIREALLFPYVGGAAFMQWFARQFPDTVPFGTRLPVSTEQILHGDRYRDGDVPVPLRFAEDPVIEYQDDLGEFEVALLFWELSGSRSVGNAGALGWDGDRYAVVTAGDDRALVWWTVWDGAAQAERFAALLERYWRRRDGRELRITSGSQQAQAAILLVDAPVGWAGWDRLPALVTGDGPGSR